MKALKITLLALAFIALQAHANDERNLAIKQVNSAVSEQRIALVIGNGAYTISPLKNPVNDAKDMAKKLRGLGFDVIERNNLQTKQIGGVLREFRSKLMPGAVALVFYAGHGLQINGINYLPAVDADINSEEDVPNQSIAVNQIMDVLDKAKTRLNLVFLDACRNNPYASRGFRSAERGLARVTAPSGTLISYATKPGSIAADGNGRNGLYTSKLLEQMDSNVQIEQTLKRVVTEVKAASQGKQEPWMEGSIEGDFCFAGCAAGDGAQVASLMPVPARVKSKEEIEDDTWSTAEAANTVEAVNAYLSGYPKGRYVAQARVKLASLKKSPQETKPSEPVTSSPAREDNETALWTEAQKGNSKDDYDAYLAQYPKGKYVALARSRIKKLQDEAANEASRKEQDAWEAADKSGSEDGYQSYLKGWPAGRYTSLAQARIKKLQTDLAARQEQDLWQKAQAGETAQTVQAYLDKYPGGSHVAAARDKLAAIKKAEAEMKPGKVFRDCPDCPDMVILPAGSFTMGSSKGGYESPAHSVTIKQAFALGKTEVTQGQWKAVMGNNPSSFSNCGDTCPVVEVSWDDAQTFIQKLNQKTGKQYRLPSEAEWEYACRAGGQHEYCGSNDVGSVAWYGAYATPVGNSAKTTNPVATKQANAFGLYDMSGNVWEWVEDSWHGNYNGAPNDGSAWSGDGAKRVLRGGSWFLNPDYSRSAFRIGNSPGLRDYSYGFRVARTLP